MVIAQVFLSLLEGFVVMAALIMMVRMLLQRVAPEWALPSRELERGYVVVTLSYMFVASVIGGYVTGWAARSNPVPDALGLAIVVLIVGGISVLQEHDRQPLWFLLVMLIVPPLGVMVGGLVRFKVMGL